MAESLRWGVLGSAMIAHKVVGAMQGAGCQVVAVASRSLERAQAFASQHVVPRAYGSYQELLADEGVEAVYIPLPTGLKREWGVLAARARKHVLVEKPFASGEDVLAIMTECRSSGVVFMDGTMFTHHTRTADFQKLVWSAQLGQVTHVNSAFTIKVGSSDNIRLDPALEPHGALGDLGWYCIMLSLAVFDWRLPQKVFAAGSKQRGVPGNVSCIMWFDAERKATFDCAFDGCIRQWGEVVGTQKHARVEDFVVPVAASPELWPDAPYCEEASFHVIDNSSASHTHTSPACRQEVRMIADFAALASERRPSGFSEWSYRSYAAQTCLDALRMSMEGEVIVPVLPLPDSLTSFAPTSPALQQAHVLRDPVVLFDSK
eukprot:CAMPEP_0177649492 /NCGR_PEP_ID=MMETSP0447-20121125/11424_1 /TAXON_ID=0 /ORGANISM="Stygamoeba regulata, Strain BSH-02190019" /LENGTH=374 /DNA_ID=CAMNT_0019152271 /DNA_START=42 /DNA_END=1166 /DNA_ORIENTATION=+